MEYKVTCGLNSLSTFPSVQVQIVRSHDVPGAVRACARATARASQWGRVRVSPALLSSFTVITRVGRVFLGGTSALIRIDTHLPLHNQVLPIFYSSFKAVGYPFPKLYDCAQCKKYPNIE